MRIQDYTLKMTLVEVAGSRRRTYIGSRQEVPPRASALEAVMNDNVRALANPGLDNEG